MQCERQVFPMLFIVSTGSLLVCSFRIVYHYNVKSVRSKAYIFPLVLQCFCGVFFLQFTRRVPGKACVEKPLFNQWVSNDSAVATFAVGKHCVAQAWRCKTKPWLNHWFSHDSTMCFVLISASNASEKNAVGIPSKPNGISMVPRVCIFHIANQCVGEVRRRKTK